ncbi:AAA family ATPase [Polynucleobacter sp. MWH-Mekk-B1]|uniref:ATP-dependent DNA helicase n=1 Tax=Polynucleobacter finlandensis TaxID=1855894 RepID=UPI001C0CBA9F|nr:DEAD/DEAH box helicase [Polynucleobacter finlandensis]MBU3543762.1 AAA family ATPase [Polynucleobacter finlandensis]
MSFLKKLEEFVGSKKANVDELRKASARTPTKSYVASSVFPAQNYEEIEVTPDYLEVIKAIDAHDPFIFVSGKAGTGKTTLIGYLREKVAGNVVVVAPTGVAALQVRGVTIHSFFRLPPRIIFPEEDIKTVKDRRMYEGIRLLIIDEISMVRADIVDAIDLFLRINGPQQGKPFGGVQVMFVGDLFQLPPVINTIEMALLRDRGYEQAHFFNAMALTGKEMTMIELQKIFRQKDKQFVDILNHIRVNEDIDEAIEILNRECYEKYASDSSYAITLTTTNAKADSINESELEAISGSPTMFIGLLDGKFNVDERNLPSPMNLTLKVGAHVMFTANDKAMPKRWVNGTIGFVREFIGEMVRVEIKTQSGSHIVDVTSHKWESYKYELDATTGKISPVVIGSYQQIPLMLAWAVTIHKSQGKTMDQVNVDLSAGAFASGQVYVALSRCRTLNGIRLKRPIKQNDVRCEPEIKRFYEALIN